MNLTWKLTIYVILCYINHLASTLNLSTTPKRVAFCMSEHSFVISAIALRLDGSENPT